MGSNQASRQTMRAWTDETVFATDKHPWFGALPELDGADFSFAVLGDRCGMATPGVFERALEMVRDLKPDFVLSVGDLIEGYWREAADTHAEWDEIDARIAATGLSFFQVTGNHDCGNPLMRDVWRERKGFEYYALRVGDALFVVLNTEDPPAEMPDEMIEVIKRATANVHREPEAAEAHMRKFYEEIVALLPPEQLHQMSRIDLAIGEAQLAFVERVLAEHEDAQRVFVAMHKPGWKSDNAAYRRIAELLDHREHTLFAGHLHAMEYSREGRGERIQLGRTGGLGHGSGPAHEHLFLWVNVRNGQPTYRVIHMDGVREAAEYAPQPAHMESHV